MSAMPFQELEIVYERLADAIDRAGSKEALFLTKLVLLLAQRQDSAGVVTASIEAALQDLPHKPD